MIGVVALMMLSTGTPFPTQAGQCGWVHARFSTANGSNFQQFWIIGTHHVMALRDRDDRYPPGLRRIVGSTAFRPFASVIFGEFYLCATERWRRGLVQHVRAVDARRLILAGG